MKDLFFPIPCPQTHPPDNKDLKNITFGIQTHTRYLQPLLSFPSAEISFLRLSGFLAIPCLLSVSSLSSQSSQTGV